MFRMDRLNRDPWCDSDNPTRVVRGASWRLAVWITATVVFFALIGLATWGFKVAISDVKGKGDAVQIRNAARNRINAQENFEQRYQDIIASDRRLTVLAAAKTATPTDRVAVTNYAGGVSYCIDAVADYNASARKFSQADFKAADLPVVIDDNDPTTDCQESAR
jgi:predicted alpha/beta hydrolase